jgi:hypothetical protein
MDNKTVLPVGFSTQRCSGQGSVGIFVRGTVSFVHTQNRVTESYGNSRFSFFRSLTVFHTVLTYIVTNCVLGFPFLHSEVLYCLIQ